VAIMVNFYIKIQNFLWQKLALWSGTRLSGKSLSQPHK
jgi:hypothetical protein